MNFLVRLATVALLLSTMVGCQANRGWLTPAPPTPPTQEQIAAADFGTMPADYRVHIRIVIGSTLKDPDSAIYNFGQPYRAASWDTESGEWIWGNAVYFSVNAKNSYGGYVGRESHIWFYDSTGECVDMQMGILIDETKIVRCEQ